MMIQTATDGASVEKMECPSKLQKQLECTKEISWYQTDKREKSKGCVKPEVAKKVVL